MAQGPMPGWRRPHMNEEKHGSIKWMDVLWLVFLLGLAVLPPVRECHKQLCCWPSAIVQLAEGRIIANVAANGRLYVVLIEDSAGHAADQSHRRTRH